jgi:hypothetical protein
MPKITSPSATAARAQRRGRELEHRPVDALRLLRVEGDRGIGKEHPCDTADHPARHIADDAKDLDDLARPD